MVVAAAGTPSRAPQIAQAGCLLSRVGRTAPPTGVTMAGIGLGLIAPSAEVARTYVPWETLGVQHRYSQEILHHYCICRAVQAIPQEGHWETLRHLLEQRVKVETKWVVLH